MRNTPWFFHGFGRAEYDRDKPVISDSIRSQVEPILKELNDGQISLEDALTHIDRIWF